MKTEKKYLERVRKYQKEHPWMTHLNSIKSRCNGSNLYYKRKGIKNFLTAQDIKFLWIRDKANKMAQASIRRKDKSKDYTINNCHFMELGEHLYLDNKIRSQKCHMPNGKFRIFPKIKDAIKADKIHEPFRLRKDVTILKVRNLFRKNYSITEIAEKLKTSKSVIHSRLNGI